MQYVRQFLPLFACFFLTVPLAAASKVIRVGPSQEVRTLQKAAEIARDGDTVEVESGDYARDVAVWTQNNLVIRGIGNRPRLVSDGAVAEEKGIFVVRGGDVRIENLAFSGARVEHLNGAGIRLEQGKLTVVNCLFEDNENGILAGNDSSIELHVIDSTFQNNGAGNGSSHNLYAGTIGLLDVRGSYFARARKGHLLKSRAQTTTVSYSRLSGEGGSGSYEIDIPNGGVFMAIGNLIQQGNQTENPVMVSFGAEGYRWPVNQAHIAFNTFVNDRSQGGVFVAVRPGADNAVISNNVWVGRGELDIKVQAAIKGNVQAHSEDFANPGQFNFRLRPGSKLAGAAGPALALDVKNRPAREYRHPAGSVELSGMTQLTPLSPGAFQRLGR